MALHTALIFLFLCVGAHAERDAAELLSAKLLARFGAIDAAIDGTLGVAAIDLSTGRIIAYNGDVVFPQASVIKVPVMAEVYRSTRDGHLRLDDEVTVTQAEAVAGGELYPALQRGPVKLTIRELVRAMIVSSDNTAANRLLAAVGIERVNAGARVLGLSSIQLRRIMLDSAAVRKGDDNVASPLDMARLMQLLSQGKVVDKDASAEMLSVMKRVDGDFRKTVPGGIDVAAKVGEYPGTRAEAGMVFLKSKPFAFSVCATYLRPGANPIPDVAAALWTHFDRLDRSNRYGNRID
jgi:beta-lactamase class A